MIGNIFVTLALMVSVFTVVMYYMTLKGYNNTLKMARLGYHISTILVVAASLLLFYAIVTHQYQYKYVYSYSGGDLPLGLLLSTFYAGQEGSFMLWLLFSSLVGVFLLDYTSKRGDLEPRVMAIYSLVIALLLIMVNPLLKSPFNFIWANPIFVEVSKFNQAYLNLPFLQNFFFSDPNSGSFIKIDENLVAQLTANGIAFNDFLIHGKGLNPLLQNFWMQIHPPILFVGFAMSAVPFTFAFSALIKNEYKDWISQSLPWILASMMVLGLAIMLGGYWAYGVLGWGGYWAWDPVENSSLVPWIIGVALIHTMLVQKRSQSVGKPRFVKTNLILAIMTFVLVLYSTFLTRSGVLGDASVHSFVDPGMLVYLLLIVLIGVFTILGFGAIIYRWKYISENFTAEENVFSRELALFTGAVTLIASAIIITVGTSAPIFGQSVELRFYNELHLPLAIIMGIINGLSLFLKWKHTEGKDIFNSLKLSSIISVVISAVIVIMSGFESILLTLFILSSVFSLVVNTEIAIGVARGKKSFLGGYITHAGMAFFFLGVIATGAFTESKQVDLVKGETQSVLGYDLTFNGYEPFDNGKKYHFNIDVAQGSGSKQAKPVMYIAAFNNSLTREPDIVNMLTEDFYISPVSYDTRGNSNSSSTKVSLMKGESYDYKGAKIKFVAFDFPQNAMGAMMEGGSFVIGAELTGTFNGNTIPLKPSLQFEGTEKTPVPVKFEEAGIEIACINLDAAGRVDLEIKAIGSSSASDSPKEILAIDASIKPFINLVWLGVIVMVIGFFISIVRRTNDAQN